MLEKGFDSKVMKIGGNPSFDRLEKYTYKRKLNTAAPKILYISQPYGGMERKLFQDVYETATLTNASSRIYVKVHPNENLADWVHFLENHDAAKIAENNNARDFLKDSLEYDIVIGYNSTIMLQTAIIDIPTISLEVDSLDLLSNFLHGNKIVSKVKYLDFEKKRN